MYKRQERDIFTVAWAMNPEEAARMAAAGADVVGAMIGVTGGGMSGACSVTPLEKAVLQLSLIHISKIKGRKMVATHKK